jgi:hypothetical protein
MKCACGSIGSWRAASRSSATTCWSVASSWEPTWLRTSQPCETVLVVDAQGSRVRGFCRRNASTDRSGRRSEHGQRASLGSTCASH